MAMRAITSEELEALPFSVSTHLSKLSHKHLRTARLSGPAWEFCSLLHDRTFGDAGFHRQNGHREYWCSFDLANWAAELEMSKSNIQRVMAELEACGIIFYLPDSNNPGSGRIGWNIHFEEWQRYDNRRTKGRLAKDTRKQASILNFPVASQEATPKQNDGKEVDPSQNADPAPGLAIRNISMVASLEDMARKNTMVGNLKSRELSMSASLQSTMSASQEQQEPSTLADPVIKVTKEEKTEEETYIAHAVAAQGALLSAPEVPPAPKKERKRDELWDAATHIFGFSPEGTAASLWGKKLKLMRKRSVPVTPEELMVLAAAYQRKYPDATFSLAAIEAHVDDLRIFIKTGGKTNGSHAGANKRATYQPQAAAGADGTGTGRDDGDEWAGWNHHKYTVTSTGVAVDQDGNTW